MIEVRKLPKRHGDTVGLPDVSHGIHRGDAGLAAARFFRWE